MRFEFWHKKLPCRCEVESSEFSVETGSKATIVWHIIVVSWLPGVLICWSHQLYSSLTHLRRSYDQFNFDFDLDNVEKKQAVTARNQSEGETRQLNGLRYLIIIRSLHQKTKLLEGRDSRIDMMTLSPHESKHSINFSGGKMNVRQASILNQKHYYVLWSGENIHLLELQLHDVSCLPWPHLAR